MLNKGLLVQEVCMELVLLMCAVLVVVSASGLWLWGLEVIQHLGMSCGCDKAALVCSLTCCSLDVLQRVVMLLPVYSLSLDV